MHRDRYFEASSAISWRGCRSIALSIGLCMYLYLCYVISFLVSFSSNHFMKNKLS